MPLLDDQLWDTAGWIWILGLLSAIELALLSLRPKLLHAPFAQARVERGVNEVTLVVPPRRGARRFVLIWTFLLSAFVAYALKLMGVAFTPLHSLMFLVVPLLFATWIIPQLWDLEVFPWHFVVSADGNLRIAHIVRSHTIERLSLQPDGQRSEISVQLGTAGIYAHHAGYEDTPAICAELSKDDAEILISMGVREGTSAPRHEYLWSSGSWARALVFLVFCALGSYGFASALASKTNHHGQTQQSESD